ncbi:MAG: helicase-exonuclease AddAB subunit AddA [Lachnospiraceae bacterium]|nr:helicase-exonuclease AddAB subunit AddA [Lachnospiraceae bacterium]
MSETKWTYDQKRAIESRGRDVLVAAAAGSGKTAVLTGRIVELLTDSKDPIDVDRILVVTFTKAAAAEMRDRISAGIESKLEVLPGDPFLTKQKLLLNYADISTIDSFCMRFIREHFEDLGIDPGSRVGEEGEINLLKRETADEVLEEYYAQGDPDFLEFVEKYAGGRDDSSLSELILDLYDHSTGNPWPDKWLDKCLEAYVNFDHSSAKQRMEELYMQIFRSQASEGLSQAQYALSLCNKSGGPSWYLNGFSADQDIFRFLLEAKDIAEAAAKLKDLKFGKIGSKPSGVPEPSDSTLVKKIREGYKNNIKDLQKMQMFSETDTIAEEMKYLAPSVSVLISLVKSFSARFAEVKKERCLIDFDDLEHFTLSLLGRPSDDGSETFPTELADKAAAGFDAVIVDEYQDCNMVQELIMDMLSGGRAGKHDRFMVGDMKQSIYMFRQADAKIFADKYEKYAVSDTALKIDLNSNFRSRSQVLESVNYIFERLMTRETSGIEYDNAARLVPGRQFPENPDKAQESEEDDPYRTEILLADYDRESIAVSEHNMSAMELEAIMAAQKIRELTDPVKGLQIYDKDLGAYRVCSFGDIAVLVRKKKGWSDTFFRVLSKQGIPVISQAGGGFFDTMEIELLTAMLKSIDNPQQDIFFTAFMHSPMEGFSSEELALMRSERRGGSIYDAAHSYAENHPDHEKLIRFLRFFDEMRVYSEGAEVPAFIRKLCDESGFTEYISVLPQGKGRWENVMRFSDLARGFAAGGKHDLYSFIQYIDSLKENGYDPGEASGGSAENCVQVMSVHKSKGLQFPVVLLSGTGQNFNIRDEKAAFLFHPELGAGLNIVNLRSRMKSSSQYKDFISEIKQRENSGEEMRILYVAMTRAEEKLIITGTVEGAESRSEIWRQSFKPGSALMNPAMVFNAKNFFDWIMPIVIRDLERPSPSGFFSLRVKDSSGIAMGETAEKMRWDSRRKEIINILEQKNLSDADDENTARLLDEDEDFEYGYKDIMKLKGKYSVSALTHNFSSIEEDFESTRLFAAPSEPGKTGAGAQEKGTAFHRVLEKLDFRNVPDTACSGDAEDKLRAFAESELSRMENSRFITDEQRGEIDLNMLVRFLSSPLCARLKKAAACGKLRRESRFVMQVPASEIDPSVKSSEPVLVQGVIDAWFTEKSGEDADKEQIVLVDYKTDRVPLSRAAYVLKKRYARQLAMYSSAVSRSYGLETGECLIYSLFAGIEIRIDPEQDTVNN